MQKPCSRGGDEQLPGNSSPAAPPGTHEPDSSFCFQPQHPLLFGSQAPIIFPCTAPLIYGEAISIFCEAGSLESTQHTASIMGVPEHRCGKCAAGPRVPAAAPAASVLRRFMPPYSGFHL